MPCSESEFETTNAKAPCPTEMGAALPSPQAAQPYAPIVADKGDVDSLVPRVPAEAYMKSHDEATNDVERHENSKAAQDGLKNQNRQQARPNECNHLTLLPWCSSTRAREFLRGLIV